MPKINYHRRKEDFNIINRVWRAVRPWFHIISFIIICAFIAGSKWFQVDGYAAQISDHDMRLTKLENHYSEIHQTLDDFRDFWGLNKGRH